MNCIIIDDDSFVRKITEDFVKKTESLTLLHSLSSAVEAINVLNSSENIDLIFLDIEMPEMSGIDFLNALGSLPQIIIISSKDKYAIDAFEYDVTDYLLKPFVYSRFCRAVNKALERQEKSRLHSKGDEIFIKHNFSLVKLKYADILWVEAMENYVIINTYDEKYTIHFTMRAIEEKLPPKQFVRVHRSFIVNTGSIHSIEDNTIQIKTSDKAKNSIPIGKSYKDNLLKDLNVILR
ncbi:MAG: LytTR family DNA-binding domain-containing protein [Tannerella sp.]|jgi:DNA-binding LytR/AlgR family response regulator|nr:LytTR family DNA-binding domain-containing protein [Tannerella sp.]